MSDDDRTRPNATGPESWSIASAVVLSVVAGIACFGIEVSFADAIYRREHGLPDVVVSHWLAPDTLEPATVTWDMLGGKTVFLLVGIATLLHPLIGRAIVAILQGLTELVDSVYSLDDESAFSEWRPEASILVGAAWPITMLAIPFFSIAVIFGYVYRTLWKL